MGSPVRLDGQQCVHAHACEVREESPKRRRQVAELPQRLRRKYGSGQGKVGSRVLGCCWVTGGWVGLVAKARVGLEFSWVMNER